MEIILRGVIENNTTTQLSKIGWDNQAAQTLNQSYDIATKSLAPYPAPHPPMLLNPRDLFSGNLECRAVPLHGRYRNTRNWVRWLHKNGVDIARPTEGIWSYHIFWPDWYSRHHPKVRHAFLHNSTCPTNSAHVRQCTLSHRYSPGSSSSFAVHAQLSVRSSHSPQFYYQKSNVSTT